MNKFQLRQVQYNKLYLLYFICLLTVVVFVLTCTINAPYADDFWFLRYIIQYFDAKSTQEKITILHSQFDLGINPITHQIDYIPHRHTLLKILMIGYVKVFKSLNIRFFVLLNAFTCVISVIYFLKLINYKSLTNIYVKSTIILILFTLVYYINIFWFVALANNMLILFGLMSMYYISRTQKKYFIFSSLLLILGAMSSQGGILFFLICLLYLFLNKHYFRFSILLVIAIICISIHQAGLHSAMVEKNNYVSLLFYCVVLFIASMGSFGPNPIICILLGITFSLALVYLLFTTKSFERTDMRYYLLLLFVLILLGISFSRYHSGIGYIINSRFKFYSILLWLTTFSLYLDFHPAIEKYSKYLLYISIIYFTFGNIISFKMALKRKHKIEAGILAYQKNKTGLFIYENAYTNAKFNSKIEEVNKTMEMLLKKNYYQFPKIKQKQLDKKNQYQSLAPTFLR